MDGAPLDLDAGDVNGDQRPDLAVACIQGPGGSGKVSVLLNNGSGAFSLQSRLNRPGKSGFVPRP